MQKNATLVQLDYVKNNFFNMNYLSKNIVGLDISKNKNSKRIIEINIKKDLLDKLIFPFRKFDITALEYKPFTRFTIAKSLDDLTSNKLSNLINSILRDRETGCFIIAPAQIGKHFQDRESYGHSLIISPWGKILADGETKEGVVSAKIDVDEVKKTRNMMPNLSNHKNYSVDF